MNFVSKAIGKAIGLTTRGLPCGRHITRYQMYRELRRHHCNGGNVLAVSGSSELALWLLDDFATVESTLFPYTDLCALPHKDDTFNMVVSDQVLEHVHDPEAAISESVRVARPGGLIVHTTCLINPVHGRPDYWRFTPDGLALLVPEGATVVATGGWGNPLVWLVVALGARFVPVPHAKWHPLHWLATWNHPDWPVVTWAVLKKS